ncbi:hypothetical protein CPB83DRAFT_909085 [Crepidotus variabilis]|uniref:MYND-type domain-containing protein n=1 Tax=Crepidotus variabilis TaxID=179855 RepID=A0A9P6E9Y2_9AGAR|nr:hypothetical protein CPB83DRAFT_909085 [Crepidotus variabilis]
MSLQYNPEKPQIYAPLYKLDKCSLCQKTDAKLRWCSSCGEILYCSTECQKDDWKRHKPECGQTDRIELGTFYPLIAGVMQSCRLHNDACQHPALLHKILSSPNPGSYENIVSLPNGTTARLVLLGDRIDQTEMASPKWWPTALSPKVRSKLMRHIVAEGLLLPTVLATTLALVEEMYTTTTVPASQKAEWQFTGRRRGTCTRVTGQDRLCYYNVNTNEFLMGQDPTDHYWIYFTTLDGHEYFLDCGMFTFNFSSIVNVSKHPTLALPPLEYIPCLFYGKDLSKVLPTTTGQVGWSPDQRFSILRHEELAYFIKKREEYCRCHDMPVLLEWLDKIAGRSCTSWEREMFLTFFENSSIAIRLNMKNRTYLKFPKDLQFGFELDPNESLDVNGEDPEGQDLEKYLKKWTRRLNKGQISGEQWNKAFRRWTEKPHDERMRMSGMTERDRKGKAKQHGSSYGTSETTKQPEEAQKISESNSGGPTGYSAKGKAKESNGPDQAMLDPMQALGAMMAEHDFMNAKAYINDKQAGEWRTAL